MDTASLGVVSRSSGGDTARHLVRQTDDLRVLRRDIGARVRNSRLALGISLQELGAPHFTRAYVSAIELGKRWPSLRALDHIARKLEVSLRTLLTSDRPASRRRVSVTSRDPRQRLGSRLRAARIANGLTPEELGRPAYAGARVLSVEEGQTNPSVPMLAYFARRLNKPMGDLIPPDV